jgi:hypothetical protein
VYRTPYFSTHLSLLYPSFSYFTPPPFNPALQCGAFLPSFNRGPSSFTPPVFTPALDSAAFHSHHSLCRPVPFILPLFTLHSATLHSRPSLCRPSLFIPPPLTLHFPTIHSRRFLRHPLLPPSLRRPSLPPFTAALHCRPSLRRPSLFILPLFAVQSATLHPPPPLTPPPLAPPVACHVLCDFRIVSLNHG